jgi:hypothetical protein
MDFSIPQELSEDLAIFKEFINQHLVPNLSSWYREKSVPRSFYLAMGEDGWLGFEMKDSRFLNCQP